MPSILAIRNLYDPFWQYPYASAAKFSGCFQPKVIRRMPTRMQDQSMLEMLGAYAAAALENARLFEAEHQRNIELEAITPC